MPCNSFHIMPSHSCSLVAVNSHLLPSIPISCNEWSQHVFCLSNLNGGHLFLIDGRTLLLDRCGWAPGDGCTMFCHAGWVWEPGCTCVAMREQTKTQTLTPDATCKHQGSKTHSRNPSCNPVLCCHTFHNFLKNIVFLWKTWFFWSNCFPRPNSIKKTRFSIKKQGFL